MINTKTILVAAILITAPTAPDGTLRTEDASPEIVLNVNMSTAAEVEAGQPLLARAGVLNADLGGDEPLTVASPDGPWPQLIRLDVFDVAGDRQDWPWQASRRNPTETRLTLEPASFAEAAWVLSPDASTDVAPGRYTVLAVLRGTAGEIKSPFVTVDITAPGAAAREDPLLQALYHIHSGESERALAVLEEAAGTLFGMEQELRGDLLNEAARYEEAMEAYGAAMAAHGHVPSRDLQRKSHEAWKKASEQFREKNPDYQPPERTGEIIEETTPPR